MEGIYFAAVSFSDLREVMAVQRTDAWLRILLFVSPIVLWLVCLFFAMRVFTPETYKTNLSSSQLAEGVYKEMVGYKHSNLKRAYWSTTGRVCASGDCLGLLPEIPGRAWLNFFAGKSG